MTAKLSYNLSNSTLWLFYSFIYFSL